MARFKDICLDASDHQALADWWCAVLGYRRRDDLDGRERQPSRADARNQGPTDGRPAAEWPIPIVDPAGQSPLIWIVPVPEPRTTRNRMHIDIFGDTAEIVAQGATLLRARGADIQWDVLADPEGNEFCVFAEPSS